MSEPNRIREIADIAAGTIQRLKGELAACNDETECKALRERIRNVRQLERWMRTRQGYA